MCVAAIDWKREQNYSFQFEKAIVYLCNPYYNPFIILSLTDHDNNHHEIRDSIR